MEKSKIGLFAAKARNLLRQQVGARLNIIKTADNAVAIENREAVSSLNRRVAEIGEEAVIDEVAYIWFNRLCALRYMDAHGFNKPKVVTPESGSILPEILSDALLGSLDYDGLLDSRKQERVEKLLRGEIRSNNAQAEVYRILLVASCNALNASIPMLFERISDYTDLLLPDDLLSEGAVISQLNIALTKEDCETVEVIGWLYQYYISEKKDEVMASFKKGKKAGSREIPPATQLFTPEWIVRYLVENSLGRLWMLNHPESRLVDSMSYYIKPVDVEPDFLKISSPEELKICDPCCGSGHMLTYAFDLLFKIYIELGYTESDAVEHIIKDNLYGIEIDNRAGQLAYFALMMKAREKVRRFFSTGIQPNICVLNNVSFTEEEMTEATELFSYKNDILISEMLNQYEHVDVLGSLVTPFLTDIDELKNLVPNEQDGDLFNVNNTVLPRVKEVLKYSEYLSKRYHVVVTNPPYLSNSHMGDKLKEYVNKEYEDYKYDVFSAFFVRCCNLALAEGYLGFMSPYVWMFITSYEKTRRFLIDKKTITTLAQLEYSAFEEATVPLCVFAIKNKKNDIRGSYFRLTEFTGGMEVQRKKILEAISNHDCGYYYEVSGGQFEKIPGSPIAYWLNERLCSFYNNGVFLNQICVAVKGLDTCDNNSYVRTWEEVSIRNIGFGLTSVNGTNQIRWYPYSKGGGFRKWYGNNTFVVNWQNDGEILRNLRDGKGKIKSRPQNTRYYFNEGLTYGAVSSADFSLRYMNNSIFGGGGSGVFTQSKFLYILIALLNCNLCGYFFDLNPTLNFCVENILSIPSYNFSENKEKIENIAKINIRLSKADWDSFETSWDFKRSPLLEPLKEPSYEEQVEMDNTTFKVKQYLGPGKADEVFYATRSICNASPLECAYARYRDQANVDFYHLKMNEEELNRIFIDIYGLQDELKPEEDEKMVSIHRIYDSESEIKLDDDVDEKGKKKKMPYAMTKKDVVEQFISYFIGCLFGRYSLNMEGLAFAGGDWDASKYDSFVPDLDNVIPILDEEWFVDDVTVRFREFLALNWGKEHVSENMKFVESALGKTLREYLVKDFYKNHLQMYKNRPIYWMFSSPKGNFNALVYLHRYNENTASVVLKYVRELKGKIKAEVNSLELSSDKLDMKKLVKYKKIVEDLDEYENILFPIAMNHIVLDLDDGVKVNYQKLGKALKPIAALEGKE